MYQSVHISHFTLFILNVQYFGQFLFSTICLFQFQINQKTLAELNQISSDTSCVCYPLLGQDPI